jgi:hypothetical protein
VATIVTALLLTLRDAALRLLWVRGFLISIANGIEEVR